MGLSNSQTIEMDGAREWVRTTGSGGNSAGAEILFPASSRSPSSNHNRMCIHCTRFNYRAGLDWQRRRLARSWGQDASFREITACGKPGFHPCEQACWGLRLGRTERLFFGRAESGDTSFRASLIASARSSPACSAPGRQARIEERFWEQSTWR
jgi:hypothetical protein